MSTVPPEFVRLARKYGPRVDDIARAEGVNPVTSRPLSGAALLLKLVKGESGFRKDAVSSAGARAWGQFMPGTRQQAIEKFNIDPWRSPAEAMEATVLHLEGKLGGGTKGLLGFNPGGGDEYRQYILSQRVGPVSLGRNNSAGGSSRTGGGGPSRSTAAAPTTSTWQPQAAVQGGGIDLGGLMERLQGGKHQPASVALPSLPFAAGPQMAGQQISLPQVAPPQKNAAGDLAALLAASGATLPPPAAVTTTTPGQPAAPSRREAAAQGSTSGRTVRGPSGKGRYPLAATAKLIGVPYSGTHSLGNWQSDNAVDLGVPNGTKVLSMRDGVVEKVRGSYSGGASRFDGYQITIRFKDGNRAFYTHLSKANVRPGMRVSRGMVIGRSGSANGVPHLHLGVEKGDPRKLIGQGR